MSARERKVVTVLFADLVSFTSRAEQLDPEDVEEMLAPYHERLRYELERWGGTVEKFIGDAVMALFGAPVTREDDPERAVRAALAIRDWIVEEGKLDVRIAVNTGEALVKLGARPEAGEGMAAGDVVNTAARLQSAAPVNGIIVGETTYRATAEAIDYKELPAVEAKGKEAPIPVWEVAQARARFGVDLTPEAKTPLVGRERELEQLVGTLARAGQQRSPELVTLVGVPGIGKSRLVGELFQSIEAGGVLTYWRQGRSLPYGEGVSYWALAEMVKAQAGILETDSDEEVRAKLARAVEQLLDEDAEWVHSHLRPLVGQASEASGSQEEAFAAWRRFFEALAEEHPLVLVFEDIQWADDGLLDFIEHLADWVSDVPILILCTARRELLERRPAWGGGKVNAATVALAPLSDEETAKLISALSDRPLFEAETQSALLDRAGGNPLYAEQYVRMLAERGSAEDLPLPESVQGIIAARLDSLPQEEKALLQDAAVIGKVFWLGALGASEQHLHPLQQKEFVQRARRSSVQGETEFAFKHLLVRDVAYGQIPRAERAQKHLRTAEWIESLGRPEDHAEMRAHHYVNALELMRAAGQELDGVGLRARDALREAGDRALALSALPQAMRYYTEALELTADDELMRAELLLQYALARFAQDETGEIEAGEAQEAFEHTGRREGAAEAALLRADIAWRRGDAETMRMHLAEAQSLVEGLPPSRIQVAILSESSRYAMVSDQNDSAVEHGREALRRAEELGLDDLRAHALNNIGAARAALGDVGGIDDLVKSVEIAREANSISELLRSVNNLGTTLLIVGRVREGREALEETLGLTRHYGHHGFARWIESGAKIGLFTYMQGQWDEALALADKFIAEHEAGMQHYQSSTAYNFRGLIRLARNDAEGAVGDAELSLELARPARDPQLVQPAFAISALTFHVAGAERRAAETLGEALDGLRELRGLGYAVVELHLLAWVARAHARQAELLDVIDRQPFTSVWTELVRLVASGDDARAGELLDEIDLPAHAAFYRLRAAEALAREGRRAEADEQLRPALAFYRSVGATRYVREGEALMAASA
jgi:class 3 adenylate cyclase/tetratricopeptide (TPR) repeat protein